MMWISPEQRTTDHLIGHLFGWLLPSTDPEDSAGGNAQAILGMYVNYIRHPGVAIFQAEDAPGERSCNYHIEPAAGEDARSIVGNLHRPLTPLWIMPEWAAAVAPSLHEPRAQFQAVSFMSDFPPAEQKLRIGRDAMSSVRSPAGPAPIKE
jgi:hypothetical protein